MELVDTHCHLQFDAYKNRQNEVIAAAIQADAKKLICVGTTLSDSKLATELAARNKDVWASVGTHPHDATKFLADPNAQKKLKALASKPRVVAIGETGLDYYRQISTKEDQQLVLRNHIEIGLELQLPLIFHIREAWDDFWSIFDSYKSAGRPIKGAVHSFSSNPTHLDQVLSRGLYVGLNGIMTFTKEAGQLKAAKAVPLDRLVLETDAPFLAPYPMRNELCEPKHVRVTAEFLAKLRSESLEQLAVVSTDNAINLFSLS